MTPGGRSGIYQILNIITRERYVGSAVNLARRWREHRRRLLRQEHHAGRLQAAWNICGETAFEFSPLLICAKEHLIEFEQAAINALLPQYNMRANASSNLGVTYSAESRARISVALKGNKCSLGHRHGPEARQKMSRAKMGHRRGMLGKRHSAETKAKMAEASRGVRHTPAARLKMSLAKKAVPLRPEVIARRIEKRRQLRLPL